MKRICCLFFLGALSIQLIDAQFFEKDTVCDKIRAGLYNNIAYYDEYLDGGDGEKIYLLGLEFKPYVAYNLYKNFYLGTIFSYEFLASNFYSRKNIMELGVTLRYLPPYHISEIRILKKLRLLFEIGYHKTNFLLLPTTQKVFEYKGKIINENFKIDNSLKNSKITLSVGVLYQICKCMYIDFDYMHVSYTGGTVENGIMGGIGFIFKQK